MEILSIIVGKVTDPPDLGTSTYFTLGGTEKPDVKVAFGITYIDQKKEPESYNIQHKVSPQLAQAINTAAKRLMVRVLVTDGQDLWLAARDPQYYIHGVPDCDWEINGKLDIPEERKREFREEIKKWVERWDKQQ